jgi:lysophospholipase L1-like esterase
MKTRSFIPILILLIWGITASLFSQQAADPDPNRYAKAIAAFEDSDKIHPFPNGGVVFVGSSSIRRLDIPSVFPGLKALNRGFGGSQISDVNHFIEETVLKYEPEVTVLYCGGNDLWARKPALQVLEDFNQFTAKLFERVPDGKLLVLAARPSPKRHSIIETELAFNYLVELKALKDDRITYIRGSCDRYFDEKGNFYMDLFADDLLHMSDAGYKIWNEILIPYLKQ